MTPERWVSVAGAAVVGLALRDIFHTLWHPHGRGVLSRTMMAAFWRMSRSRGHRGRMASLAGPLGMVAVFSAWTVTIVLGWALVYWPHVPGGFIEGTGVRPRERADFLDALYFSLVTVSTLGYGDIVPDAGWLRLAAPLQALVGFGLLTAAVSWGLQVHPALRRRRVLAMRLALLHRVEGSRPEARFDRLADASLLESLAAEVVQVRADLAAYTESYYFHDAEQRMSLAAMSGYALDLADRGRASPREDVRLGSAVLAVALDELAEFLKRYHLRTAGGTREALAAYAADHGHHLASAPFRPGGGSGVPG